METSPNFFPSTSYPSAPALMAARVSPGTGGAVPEEMERSKGSEVWNKELKVEVLASVKILSMQEHSFPTTIFILWAEEGALQSSGRRGACLPGKGVEAPPSQNALHVFTCKVGMVAWLVWAEGLRQPLPQVSHRSG